MGKKCDGDHGAPPCEDPHCWTRDPLVPIVDSNFVMFRTPDGEAVYLDGIEARDLAKNLVLAADELDQETKVSP
jgi:hypothetical protein